MYKHCMNGYKNNVYIKNGRRKAQNIQGNESHGSCKKYIYKMGTATCQPIHTFCRMVYGVKPPQGYTRVKKTMCPILEKVCGKKSQK
ncbi:hypothetical protein D3C72_1911460 [compost metagenome]